LTQQGGSAGDWELLRADSGTAIVSIFLGAAAWNKLGQIRGTGSASGVIKVVVTRGGGN